MTKGGSKPGAAKPRAPATSAHRTRTNLESDSPIATSAIPDHQIKLYQKCLDIFCDALKPSQEDSKILQEVKGHLYRRNFAVAFGQEDYLRVYASRWSPSRALAYSQIFQELPKGAVAASVSVQVSTGDPPLNIVCIGGGAGAELVGLAASLSAYGDGSVSPSRRINATFIDIAGWATTLEKLHTGILNPPQLSRYASQAKKDANKALLEPGTLSMDFERMDILQPGTNSLLDLVQGADVVTFMFTLNELYSTSMQKTQHLLSTTLSSMPTGSHLLVVDSPGSYSTISLNGAEKKYPMQWLLKYTLLGDSGKTKDGSKPAWSQVLSEDSRWFRLPTGLRYPIELEDMRYQIHLFRREASDIGGAA